MHLLAPASSGDGLNAAVYRDLNNRQCIAVLRDHDDRVNTMAWHPEGMSFASAGAEGCIKVGRLAPTL